MKKTILVVVLLAFVFVFGGCQRKADRSEQVDESTVVSHRDTITFGNVVLFQRVVTVTDVVLSEELRPVGSDPCE